uniref:Erythrocyte membrane protein band 4.1 like 2 n=1 Tax=Terrapene triunguis TaxID=2587831 RepID=A0A674IAK5_9SAUR
MTTEAGPETEVKKESEQLGADAAKETHEEATESQENQKSEKTLSEEAQSSPPSPALATQSSPSSQKKEKDPSEGKGISRFIPPWLKKQKSYTLVEPKDEVKKKPVEERPVMEERESQLPEDMAQPKGNLEEATIESQQEAKADDKEEEEKHSVSSADTQPAKEDNKEIEVEKVADEQEEKQKVEEKRETKEVQTAEIKMEKAPQKAPKKIKTVPCKVMLLDGTEYSCDLEKRAKGQVLFDKVCEQLNLLEKDYFGLLLRDNSDQKNWLDSSKEIKRQIRSLPWLFTFNVKFYPPDPSQLTEDITRYFLCLQLRQDIASGRLPCSFVTHALLGSYTLQAELGDYDSEEHNNHYISEFQFAPNQTKEMEEKVVELHKTHRCVRPGGNKMLIWSWLHLSFLLILKICIKLSIVKQSILCSEVMKIKISSIPRITKIFCSVIAPVGITDQSLLRDFSATTVGPAGVMVFDGEAVGQTKLKNGEGRDEDGSPTKIPQLELTQDEKDLDKTQDDLLKHQASISELKRNFMESTPEPRPNEWEKRRITPLSLQTQGVCHCRHLSACISVQLFRKYNKCKLAEGPCTGASDADKSSHETLNVVEEKKQAEVGIEETVVIDEINRGKMQAVSDAGETHKVEHVSKKDSSSLSSDSSSSSSSESEDEVVGEYQPHHRATEDIIREEQEENEDAKRMEECATKIIQSVETVQEGSKVRVEHTQVTAKALAQENAVAIKTAETNVMEEGKQDLRAEDEEEQLRINGDVSHVDIDVVPQIICCSEPPVVKTEMVTISDATQRTEISTKEVPIVQTETKTITYESPQFDGSAGGDAGVLLSAQTITSESVSTTTTTHITKTVKGGVSETRIEKRIVITGDADIDHDQALAQAIKEAKEQHPDMSVTRVVVHKETELAEEGEE